MDSGSGFDLIDRPSSGSGSESSNSLIMSGRWSDSEPNPSFYVNDNAYSDGVDGQAILLDSASHPPTVEDDDRLDAPVLYLKRTFRVPAAEIIAAIDKTFSNANLPDVKVVSIHITSNPARDHAYLVLNSKAASNLLADGTLTAVVYIMKQANQEEEEYDGSDEDNEDTSEILWFEKATVLAAVEGQQDPYTLYLWQLPTNRKGSDVLKSLKEAIEPLCPIVEIDVDEKENGFCSGWAKVCFNYEFDTQKCIYILNYSHFLDVEIRAGFFNLDRKNTSRPRPQGNDQRSRPRPTTPIKAAEKSPNKRTPVKKNSNPREKPMGKKAIPTAVPAKKKAEVDPWAVVGREGRHRK